MSDTDSVDSEVELHVAPLGQFSAQQFMENMGYIPGQGLGAESQGIAAPIEVELRAKKSGLGSEQQQLETQNKPTEDPVLRKKSHIEQEIGGLETVLNSIDKLDLVQFYDSFSHYDFWDDLQLWQVVRHKLGTKLLAGANPFSLEIVLDLEVAQQCVPRVEYARLLSDSWVPLALQSDIYQLVDFMGTHYSLMEPVANNVSYQLAPRLVEMSDSLPVLLESLTLLPSFRQALSRYVSELPEITPGNLDLIKIFLDTTKNYRSLPIKKNMCFDQLVHTADMFQGTIHYPEIMRSYVMPHWLRSLETSLVRNELNQLDHEICTLKMRIFEEPLFITGLQLINAYFDTLRLESPKSPTLITVLGAFCVLKGYQHISSTEESGKIVGENNQILNYHFVGDELFGRVDDGPFLPLRIQDIDSLIIPLSNIIY